MSNNLSLYIKKTNKHLYVYLLQNNTQVLSVSTDGKLLKKKISSFTTKQLPELLGHMFAHKLLVAGIYKVRLHQTNIFHGKIATIVQTIRQCGIYIK